MSSSKDALDGLARLGLGGPNLTFQFGDTAPTTSQQSQESLLLQQQGSSGETPPSPTRIVCNPANNPCAPRRRGPVDDRDEMQNLHQYGM